MIPWLKEISALPRPIVAHALMLWSAGIGRDTVPVPLVQRAGPGAGRAGPGSVQGGPELVVRTTHKRTWRFLSCCLRAADGLHCLYWFCSVYWSVRGALIFWNSNSSNYLIQPLCLRWWHLCKNSPVKTVRRKNNILLNWMTILFLWSL